MMRSIGRAALAFSLATGSRSWSAENAAPSGPPAWQDQASVYLTMNDTVGALSPKQPAAVGDNRRLAPPSAEALTSNAKYGAAQVGAVGEAQRSVDFGLPLRSAYTVVSALAIVIGAFLLCAWLLRRGRRSGAQSLPAEVVSVLGSVQLEARQFAKLLRVGNKLVMISVTPSGAKTITEVTDPVEVDRIVGLCQQSHPHSTTKAFEQVFRQLSHEPTASGFLSEEMTGQTAAPSLDMFRSQLGETARA